MKTMHVVVDFPPAVVGGMEVHVYYLAMELSKLGIECIVVHGGATEHLIKDNRRNFSQSFNSDLFRVNRVLSLNILGKSSCFMPTLPLVIRQEKPDIIHVHGYWNLYTIEVGLMSFLSKIPCLLTVHGIGDLSLLLSRRLILSIHDNVMRHILPFFDKVIAVSSHTKRELEERGCHSGKVVVIPNGVRLSDFILPSGEGFKKRLGLSSQKIIISIGRVSEVKGYQYMIEAMRVVIKKMDDVVYLIIGADAGYKAALQRKTKALGLDERVLFLGFVSEEEKLEAISASSLFVIPSLYEGLPLVLLEAMAAGKPIVSTRIGGILDVVKHESAILVPPCDSIKLAEAIIQVFSDDQMRESLTLNAKKESKQFEWNSVAEKTKQLYEYLE